MEVTNVCYLVPLKDLFWVFQSRYYRIRIRRDSTTAQGVIGVTLSMITIA